MLPSSAFRLPLDELPDPLPIPRIERPFHATIRPPGSKSLTNRALLLAALSRGTSTLRNALVDADDARVMIGAIQQLGAAVGSDPSDPTTLRITGTSGEWRPESRGGGTEPIVLRLANAGTATRFLAAAALLAPPGTPILIDGDPRMRERPIGELVDALNRLSPGLSPPPVSYEHRVGYPPIRVRGIGYHSSDGLSDVTFDRTQSSQFVSAVMLVGAFFRSGITVRFSGPITSEPYVRMTLELLRRWGVPVQDHRPTRVHIGFTDSPEDPPPRRHRLRIEGQDLEIEPDASGASYFWAAAALIPGSAVTVPSLDTRSGGCLQGDAAFVDVLERAGVLVRRTDSGAAVELPAGAGIRAFDEDFAGMPDVAMTAAVVACFAAPTQDNPTATSLLHGLRTLRVKETDRLAALRSELTKLGVGVEIVEKDGDESLRVTPPPGGLDTNPGVPPVHFDTYNDHRMAMALALVGLRRPNVFIRDPGCVRKTYPGFWSDLASLYGVE